MTFYLFIFNVLTVILIIQPNLLNLIINLPTMFLVQKFFTLQFSIKGGLLNM